MTELDALLIGAVVAVWGALVAVWAELVRLRRAEQRCRQLLDAQAVLLEQLRADQVHQHAANVRRLEALLDRADRLGDRPGPEAPLS